MMQFVVRVLSALAIVNAQTALAANIPSTGGRSETILISKPAKRARHDPFIGPSKKKPQRGGAGAKSLSSYAISNTDFVASRCDNKATAAASIRTH